MNFFITSVFGVSAVLISLCGADASVGICQATGSLDVASSLQCDHALERDFLNEIEPMLGSEHRTFVEKRLASIKQAMLPIFTAIPKNDYGSLSHSAAKYILSRTFVQRHAWSLKGLAKATGSWDNAGQYIEHPIVSILKGKVPEKVFKLLRSRTRHGFTLNELVVFAGTVEYLVHKESILRLDAAYRSLSLGRKDILSADEVEDAMDSYMSLYILGSQVSDLSKVSPSHVRTLRGNITNLYPGFPETQTFVREVQQSVVPEREQFFFPEVANLVEEIGDRYGLWQDNECRTMKEDLLELEDKSVAGAGKVLLTDFYDAAANRGKWQFREHIDFLRAFGALDESDPQRPRVIIPNYVHAPSNCVASSSYYHVCCVNECDELMGQLEAKLAKPEASPSEIIKSIEAMPSSTVSHNRTLPAYLLRHLQETADVHGGLIPIHGRLFGQWMHFAYPRECSYPQTSTKLKPMTEVEWIRLHRRETSMNTTEMWAYLNASLQNSSADIEEPETPSSLLWTMDEELVVNRPPRTVWQLLATAVRHLMSAGVIGAVCVIIYCVGAEIRDAMRRSAAIQSKYDL